MKEAIRKDIDAICSIYPTIRMYDEPRERLAGRIARHVAKVTQAAVTNEQIGRILDLTTHLINSGREGMDTYLGTDEMLVEEVRGILKNGHP